MCVCVCAYVCVCVYVCAITAPTCVVVHILQNGRCVYVCVRDRMCVFVY